MTFEIEFGAHVQLIIIFHSYGYVTHMSCDGSYDENYTYFMFPQIKKHRILTRNWLLTCDLYEVLVSMFVNYSKLLYINNATSIYGFGYKLC
jgi:hypothetical protein